MKPNNFINNHRIAIGLILGNKCFYCGKETKTCHHINYQNLPNNVFEHCKYLRPVCLSCHRKIHTGEIKENNEQKKIFS